MGSLRYWTPSDFQTAADADDDSFELKADDGAAPGTLIVKFSTFDIKDSYGDIIRASALDDYVNKEVAMVWSHKASDIIGKGMIRTEGKKAIWDGQLFVGVGIPEADKAYATVKAMGKLQEYSWGFRILEAKPIKEKGPDGQLMWTGGLEITKTAPHEVSPVLKGANPRTGTLLVKAEPVGLTVAQEHEAALAAVTSFIARERSLAEKRGEQERPLNAVNRERLKSLQAELTLVLNEIDDLLIEAVAEEPAVAKSDPFQFHELRKRQYAFYQSLIGE